MNRLVLIDGNAVLHRAYHAIPPLTAPDGTLVNAVYGFAAMLLRLHRDLKPSHIAVAFDRPKPTFRKKMFKKYQATRPKMDDDLVGQIEKVHELIRSFGIPIFEKDGFEADDVIGTVARQVIGDKKQEKIDQVIIVTGDRDILQLVKNDTVLVYMPTKGLSEAKLYRETDVKERLGVDPNKIADYKGLAGDASDNYPGVEGIGPKTAVSLIETFGTVENVYKALDKKDKRIDGVSASVIDKLRTGEKSAILSKDLATIRTDVPLEGDIADSHITSLDTPKARQFFSDIHFHSLLKRLENSETSKHPEQSKKVEKEKVKRGEQQQLF